MRFRDVFPFLCVLTFAVAASLYGWSGFQGSFFESKEINRDDAERQSTTLLSTDRWVEFQVAPGANNFRLLTNAALNSVDAPDFDLSDPRLGQKYAIEYELLDPNRNLIRSSTYHFRSEIRQLLDSKSEEIIYPLFFGRDSLVSTQTRAMQMAVNRNNERSAILRVRLLSHDVQI